MRVIGLTGSIATGKTTIGKMCNHLKIPVHDADKTVHDLIGPNGTAVPMIVEMFGDIRTLENGIDRQKLGKIIFSGVEEKKALESIIHPLVESNRNKFLSRMKSQRQKMVVVDIPLLFETGCEVFCDSIICVWAPEFLQRQRALARLGMSEKKLSDILSYQLPQKVKMQLADFCLPTGLGKAYSYKLLKRWLFSLRLIGFKKRQ